MAGLDTASEATVGIFAVETAEEMLELDAFFVGFLAVNDALVAAVVETLLLAAISIAST